MANTWGIYRNNVFLCKPRGVRLNIKYNLDALKYLVADWHLLKRLLFIIIINFNFLWTNGEISLIIIFNIEFLLPPYWNGTSFIFPWKTRTYLKSYSNKAEANERTYFSLFHFICCTFFLFYFGLENIVLTMISCKDSHMLHIFIHLWKKFNLDSIFITSKINFYSIFIRTNTLKVARLWHRDKYLFKFLNNSRVKNSITMTSVSTCAVFYLIIFFVFFTVKIFLNKKIIYFIFLKFPMDLTFIYLNEIGLSHIYSFIN